MHQIIEGYTWRIGYSPQPNCTTCEDFKILAYEDGFFIVQEVVTLYIRIIMFRQIISIERI